jgi:hypothetical protein
MDQDLERIAQDIKSDFGKIGKNKGSLGIFQYEFFVSSETRRRRELGDITFEEQAELYQYLMKDVKPKGGPDGKI